MSEQDTNPNETEEKQDEAEVEGHRYARTSATETEEADVEGHRYARTDSEKSDDEGDDVEAHRNVGPGRTAV